MDDALIGKALSERLRLEQTISRTLSSAVVGITARSKEGHSPEALIEILVRVLGGSWQAEVWPTGYLDARPTELPQIDAGRAWAACRWMNGNGFENAEPIYLVALPSPEEPGGARHLKLWGVPYTREDEQRMEQISRDTAEWAVEQMNVVRAWKRCEERGIVPGQGVVVGHPDTGYSHHPLIADNLQLDWSKSFLPGENDAKDAFVDGLGRNPGHGTATGSLIVGRNPGFAEVRGIAPGARLVPLRVSTSVIHFDFVAVAQAIEHAAENGADVISMSLGGPMSSKRLEAAIRHALDRGIIVVSAAGNQFPTVVFPAAIPGVVAMAASNPLERPWRFSGFGDEVVATAPGEFVWNGRANRNGHDGSVVFGQDRGAGTSFATAHVAGIAAMWLSYHGKDQVLANLDGDQSLLPFAFHLLLQEAANQVPKFVETGGFGAGIVDADRLLGLPLGTGFAERVREHRSKVLGKRTGWLQSLVGHIGIFLRVPTRSGFAEGQASMPPLEEGKAERALAFLLQTDDLKTVEPLLDELVAILAGKDILRNRLIYAGRLPDASRQAVLNGLRRELRKEPLSGELRAQLADAVENRSEHWEDGVWAGAQVAAPLVRRLRVYTFDPSLSTHMETLPLQTATIELPWEDLKPGPVGEYVEVVDVDPASDCVYRPVDLNDPYLLAQDGHEPSMGNPQFHQQMVYAVAMKTITTFEKSLGRPLFWSPIRPWHPDDREKAEKRLMRSGQANNRDQCVPRLRIHPHALRDQNAYYSPSKRALLFGYFNATENSPGEVYPGGIVFTCLSHDIIAHEVTHAIIDGMHTDFNQPTNPDVYAFHEAISDVVALFLHFSYADVVRSQIAKTRGDLNSQNLLLQLAQEFGRATGGHHALRDALGGIVAITEDDRDRGRVEHKTVRPAPGGGLYERVETRRVFQRYQPDPSLIESPDYASEAHKRGSLLVAAIFDAFLAIYESRSADLVRIATGGTGVLPEGHLQPDLVDRMATEARKAAEHVLRMCIRGLDYTPPLDITFGEFLRAVITADKDLVPSDPLNYRVAFIESFRKWGIYPRDVRVLAEESLLWHPTTGTRLFNEDFTKRMHEQRKLEGGPSRIGMKLETLFDKLRRVMNQWSPGADRQRIFDELLECQYRLSRHLKDVIASDAAKEMLPGLHAILRETFVARGEDGKDLIPRLGVSKLRPARRIGPNNEFKIEMVFEVTAAQPIDAEPAQNSSAEEGPRFLSGVTLVVDMESWNVRYAIMKRMGSAGRYARYVAYQARQDSHTFGAAEYRCGDYDEGRITEDRAFNLEAMRADSCVCRKTKVSREEMMREPFAMLHRGNPQQEDIDSSGYKR